MTNNENLNLSELKTMLENHFADTKVQISDMKVIISDIKKDNAEFRLQMNKDFQVFTEKVDKKLDRVDVRLDSVQSEIHQIDNKITGLEHDVANLQMWNYWTLSIILALAAMPHIIAGIKSLFSVISGGIIGILQIFKKEKSEN